MRKAIVLAAAVLLLQAAPAVHAANVNFSINVGGPPVVITQAPDFLYPPELGFGVAVGVPYDLFYANGAYYLYRGGWYRASYYGDRWVPVYRRDLPPEFRRYKIGQINSFRDREYRMYARDHEHYRGRHFRPEGRGDGHRDMRGPGREEHREMREGHGDKGQMRGRGPEGREMHGDRGGYGR